MQAQYILPVHTSAIPLLPNGNGTFRLGWNVTLPRGTSVEICDYFNAKLATIRHKDALYFLPFETDQRHSQFKYHTEQTDAEGRERLNEPR